jgi:hypothetical protein
LPIADYPIADYDPRALHLTVPIISRQRARMLLLQKLEHALPSAVLLADGLRRFVAEPTPLSIGLGVAEVATSALVLRAFVQAARSAFKHDAAAHAHYGPDWLDIFLSGMVLTEVAVHYHETGHVTRPKVLLAFALLFLGLDHGRQQGFIRRRRSLTIDDEGLRIRVRLTKRLKASWDEIDRIDLGPRYLTIATRTGRELKIDANDLINAQDVRAAMEQARDHLQARRANSAPTTLTATDAQA